MKKIVHINIVHMNLRLCNKRAAGLLLLKSHSGHMGAVGQAVDRILPVYAFSSICVNMHMAI